MVVVYDLMEVVVSTINGKINLWGVGWGGVWSNGSGSKHMLHVCFLFFIIIILVQ